MRDLGAWCVHIAEQAITGTYNATGFPGPLSLMEFLHGCKCAITTECRFTWVGEAFLERQEIGPWMELPLWLPSGKLPLVLGWMHVALWLGRAHRLRVQEDDAGGSGYIPASAGEEPGLRN